MAYIAPAVDVAGLHVPTYDDILDDLLESKRNIYGSDIYLEEDSTDYQELSVLALKMYDVMMAVQLAYNNRSPLTAVGAGLDGVVKINGIARQGSTYSTVSVLLAGTVGAVITNGQVQDTAKQTWNLPASVTIPAGGLITVTATADVAGAVQALAGTVNKILTVQAGWTSVTNLAAATPGTAPETDSALRNRQSTSTEISATTPMSSVMSAVAAVSGVSRSRGYENDTASTDGNGVPAHSIAVVTEGGDSTDIAEAIALKKTMGTGTYGSLAVSVTDYAGYSMTINFSPATPVYIYVKITIDTKTGYTASIGTQIKEAVQDYINSIDIGEDVFRTKVVAAASLWGTAEAGTFTITAVELGQIGDSPTTSDHDVVIDFNELAVTYTETSPDFIELVTT